MANTKNPALLWNVSQHGTGGADIGESGRTTAQGNLGIGEAFVKSAVTSNFVTNVSRTAAGDLQVNVAQPALSDIAAVSGSATAIEANDQLLIADATNNKIVKGDITFDGSTDSQALTKKGTFETFLQEHRAVNVDGVEHLSSSSSTALNLKKGTNVTITAGNNGDVTISATDTKYTFSTGLTTSGTGNTTVAVTNPVPTPESGFTGRFLTVTNSSGGIGWGTLPSAGGIDYIQVYTSSSAAQDAVWTAVDTSYRADRLPILYSNDGQAFLYWMFVGSMADGYEFSYCSETSIATLIINKDTHVVTVVSKSFLLPPTGDASTPIYVNGSNSLAACTSVVFESSGSENDSYTIGLYPGQHGGATYLTAQKDVSDSFSRSVSVTPEATIFTIKPSSLKLNTALVMSDNTSMSGDGNSMVRQLPTAIHSVYDGTSSRDNVSTNRLSLFGGYEDSDASRLSWKNLGNLSVASLAIRPISSNATSVNHPLLPSCVLGELTYLRFAKVGNTLADTYIKDSTSVSDSSYIGTSEDDGMLLITTKARNMTDEAAREAAYGSAGLGRFTAFPSKAYVDGLYDSLSSSITAVNTRINTVAGDMYMNSVPSTYTSMTTTQISNLVHSQDFTVDAYSESSLSDTVQWNLMESGTYNNCMNNGGFVAVTVTSNSNGIDASIEIRYHKNNTAYTLWTWPRNGSELNLELYSTSAIVPFVPDASSFYVLVHNETSSSRKFNVSITWLPISVHRSSLL